MFNDVAQADSLCTSPDHKLGDCKIREVCQASLFDGKDNQTDVECRLAKVGTNAWRVELFQMLGEHANRRVIAFICARPFQLPRVREVECSMNRFALADIHHRDVFVIYMLAEI